MDLFSKFVTKAGTALIIALYALVIGGLFVGVFFGIGALE